jgi:hypothetical protein
MVDFVVISADSNIANGKKYDVMKIDTPIVLPDTPTEWETAIGGNTIVSEGVGKKRWEFQILVFYGETRVGYGTMANIVSVLTTAGVTRAITDWYGTTYSTVKIINKGDWKGIMDRKSPTIDSARSAYFVKLEFRE